MQPFSNVQLVFELLEGLKSLLYIFVFLFYFLDLFFSFFRIKVVDSSLNVEMRSLYIEFHLCLNASGIKEFFWNPVYLV